MMGVMMPKTCWDRSLIINSRLVTSCWFISRHPTFHDARSQEPKTLKLKSLSTCILTMEPRDQLVWVGFKPSSTWDLTGPEPLNNCLFAWRFSSLELQLVWAKALAAWWAADRKAHIIVATTNSCIKQAVKWPWHTTPKIQNVKKWLCNWQ